jgi:hypothetical protein
VIAGHVLSLHPISQPGGIGHLEAMRAQQLRCPEKLGRLCHGDDDGYLLMLNALNLLPLSAA